MTVDIWNHISSVLHSAKVQFPQGLKFFRPYFRYYLRSVQCFEDCFHIYFLIRSSHIIFLYIHSHFCFVVKNLGCENLREISKLLWPKTKSKVAIPFTKYSETSPRSLLRHGKCANWNIARFQMWISPTFGWKTASATWSKQDHYSWFLVSYNGYTS